MNSQHLVGNKILFILDAQNTNKATVFMESQ